MNVAIIGYGRQGQSAAEYWHKKGASITVCDQKENIQLPDWITPKLGPDHLKNLDVFDLIIRSPIVHPAIIVKENSPGILTKVTSTTNEFLSVCPTKNIIGVTGTKGKGTTSTLIAKILEADGKKVHLGGNIGLDPLLLLKNNIQKNDWVVLELANFQLIDLKKSTHIAVCLMVDVEHLDWHQDFEEYIDSKQQLFINQTKNDIAIYYPKNGYSISIASVSQGIQIPYLQKPGAYIENDQLCIEDQIICDVSDIKLIGKHNWQNVCAAVTAVWQITHNIQSIKKAISAFSGLPHRIEFIREKNGVSFYNDSFATGQGATIAAISAIKDPKVLILGGHDRELELENLFDEIKTHKQDISTCILIGATSKKLAKGLKSAGLVNYEVSNAKTMKEIVKLAYSRANNGDSVVFSPGFASFDMFDNFEDRGNQFREQVLAL